MRIISVFLLVGLILSGTGCVEVEKISTVPKVDVATSTTTIPEASPSMPEPVDDRVIPSRGPALTAPMFYYYTSKKKFGEYFEDRFTGYHAGDDLEAHSSFLPEERNVFAIANGTVRYVNWVSGYGGVIVIEHLIEGETISAIYGHVRLADTVVKVGDVVETGQLISTLGTGFTKETDGEREHLHFALYKGKELRLVGYVQKKEALEDWINPATFLLDHAIFLDRDPA